MARGVRERTNAATGRESIVSVRLTHDEDAVVRREAERRGESISTFFRDAAMRECGKRAEMGGPTVEMRPRTVGASLTLAYGSHPGHVELLVGSGPAIVSHDGTSPQTQ
jgi:hypothetical protein